MEKLPHISQKRWSFVLLLMFVANYVHATTITYTADLSKQDQLAIITRGTAYSATTSPATEASFTYKGMKFYSNGGYIPQGNTNLRVFGGKSLDITSYIGNITKVIVTVTESKYMDLTLTPSDNFKYSKDKSNLRYTFTFTAKEYPSSFSFKTNGVIWISKIAVTIEQPSSYSLSISQFGYSSLFHGEYDLQLPSDQSTLTAYTLALKDGQLEPMHTFYAGDVIPKGTSVLVKGAQGTYYLPVSTTSSTAEYDNELQGLDVPGMIIDDSNSDDYYYYKLTTLNNLNFGFYWGADEGAPFELKNAHRAYLRLPKNLFETSEQAKAFDLEDVLDVITEARKEDTHPTKLFDLTGRQVSHPVKGVYICNGKKVLIR